MTGHLKLLKMTIMKIQRHLPLFPENNLACDCRLLWLYELRNRTRSGSIQKSLDNLNCDLKERDQDRTEQVFLLRLHYENFDCASTMATTELTSNNNNNIHRHSSRVRPIANIQASGGGLRIFKDKVNGLLAIVLAILLSKYLCPQ